MATYADGTTIAEVGDIVKCVEPKRSMCLTLDRDCTYRVLETNDSYINVEGNCYVEGNFSMLYADRFELVKRTGAVQSPAKDEPLVKWPEPEKQICSGHLPIGDFFTIEHDDRKVWRVVDGGYIAWFGDFSASAYVVWPHNNTPVRRLKMLVRPKFEVI